MERAYEGMRSMGGEERTNYPITFSVDDLGHEFGLTAQVASSVSAQSVCDYMHACIQSACMHAHKPVRAFEQVCT